LRAGGTPEISRWREPPDRIRRLATAPAGAEEITQWLGQQLLALIYAIGHPPPLPGRDIFLDLLPVAYATG